LKEQNGCNRLSSSDADMRAMGTEKLKETKKIPTERTPQGLDLLFDK